MNSTYVIPNEVSHSGMVNTLLIPFFYPLYVFFDSTWNFYHVMLSSISAVFLLTLAYGMYKKYFSYSALVLLVILALANIRWINPSTNFYIAYHGVVWFGMFCFSVGILLNEIVSKNKKNGKIFIGITLMIIASSLIYPKSFLWEHIDRSSTFTINYNKYYTNGEIVRLLSQPKDTLFIDDWDSLIYWQAKRDSSYKYAMYYPVTSQVPVFSAERLAMFHNNMPDFYYTDCGKNTHTDLIPKSVQASYIQLLFSKKPTCLYIKKSIASGFTKEQLNQLHALQYYLPANGK